MSRLRQEKKYADGPATAQRRSVTAFAIPGYWIDVATRMSSSGLIRWS